jgi:peptidoglycan/LPS O-acetylase OafA/YrhL
VAERRRDPSAARPTYRPEIQGLRALAVSLVVVYHVWPGRLPGGYIGVDVFFVISGFLITEQLLGELRRDRRVSLARFYGRRARRLLPAAAFVLAVIWVASRLILPSTQLPETADEIRASALYFQNWLLAHNAVDYLHATQAPSPVQHFWSLSVEEQFYLLWPLLFLAAGLLLRRRGRIGYAALGLLTAGVFAVSLYISITATAADPAAAYFTTTTRMWELAAGGLLALAGPRVRRFLGREGAAGWAGLALVLAGAFLISDSTAFPGWIALVPVGGTVLLLTAGSAPARFGPGLVLNRRPLIVLGGISYGIYLWHWPLIILWKAYWGTTRIGLIAGAGLIAGTVLLAWLMKMLLEDPVRLRPFIARYSWRSLATASAVVVPVVLVSVFIHDQPPPWHGGIDKKHPGGAVLAEGRSVPQARPVPPVDSAKHDEPDTKGDTCLLAETETGTHTCTFGDTDHPKLTVALVGDSMAAQWLTALEEIAHRRHLEIVTELHSRCQFSATMTIDRPGHEYTVCHDWAEDAQHEVLTRIKPDVVITSDRPELGTPDHPHAGREAFEQIGAGMYKYWKQLLDAGIQVVPIRETPEMEHNVPDCLASRTGDRSSCSADKSAAIVRDTPTEVATRAAHGRVDLVDMNSFICGSTTCRPVEGNVAVYRDSHHLTNTYVKTIAPFLEQRLLATHALHRIG